MNKERISRLFFLFSFLYGAASLLAQESAQAAPAAVPVTDAVKTPVQQNVASVAQASVEAAPAPAVEQAPEGAPAPQPISEQKPSEGAAETVAASAPAVEQPAEQKPAEAAAAAPAQEAEKPKEEKPAQAAEAAKPEPEKKAMEVIAQSEVIYKDGIDTIEDEDSGNWYLKRSSWKKARPRYDKIRKAVQEVDNASAEFLEELRKFKQHVDEFYATKGIIRGEILEQIKALSDSLKKERATAPEGLTSEQFKQLDDVQNKKEKDLQKLKNDFEALHKIYQNLSDTILGTLVEQVKASHAYQEKALESYYTISEILDDKKAKSLLDDMDNYMENVQAISAWIGGPLRKYVDDSMAKIHELIATLAQDISDLKESGIVLKQQVISAAQNQLDKERKRNEAEKEEILEVAVKEINDAQKKPSDGIFTKIMNWFSWLFSSIWNGISSSFSWVYGKIFSSSKAPQAAIDKKDVLETATI